MENIFIGIFRGNESLGGMKFNSIDDVTIEFLDQFFDGGYELKKITQEEFENFRLGDELTVSDIKNNNFFIENN